MRPKTFERLIDSLRLLNGIGKRQAERIAYHLISSNDVIASELLQSLTEAKKKIEICKVCFLLTEKQPCEICADDSRTNNLLIVESPLDVFKFEEVNLFKGKYHVLNGLINLSKGIEEEDLNLSTLKSRSSEFKEVILALSQNISGQITSEYIISLLKNESVKITQLASGIPVGASIEYVDGLTFSQALHNRKEVK